MSYKLGERNKLQVSCDWLGFTILNTTDIEKVLGLFGFSIEAFKAANTGSRGYKKQFVYQSTGLKILYDGQENMGIHVDVNSKSLSYFVDTYRDVKYMSAPFIDDDYYVFVEVLKTVLENGHISRFDIAIDDIGENYYSVDEIAEYYKQKRIRTKFKKYLLMRPEENYKVIGNTVNFGSRESEIFLRIYDKALEQAQKNNDSPDKWVRWEFELKGEKANQFVKRLIDGENFVALAFSLLNGYFNIIDITESNRSRCPVNEKWKEFIQSADKFKFIINKTVVSIEQKLEYLERQVSRSLAMVLMSLGGDMDYLTGLLQVGMEKLTIGDFEIINQYMTKHSEDYI